MSEPFSSELRAFIASAPWTFAKTMPEWPHEYLVRGRVDPRMYAALAAHIIAHGFEGRFYRKTYTYFVEDGYRYWVIGNILNRCKEEDSYDRRVERGDLPC